jgi:hypothetical protein
MIDEKGETPTFASHLPVCAAGFGTLMIEFKVKSLEVKVTQEHNFEL